jgi:hypothetical protein
MITNLFPVFISNTWLAPEDIVRIISLLELVQTGVIGSPESLLEVGFVWEGLE